MKIRIRPFDPSCLDEAAALLAERHRRHRLASPGLDPAFEDPARARAELERLTEADGATGAMAVQDDRLVGYLLGVERDRTTWGGNAWVESAGHAVVEPGLALDLYRVAAAAWVDAGRTCHYVVAPAGERDLIETWFRLGFGQQQVHALREPPPASFQPRPRAGVTIRRAIRQDIADLAVLDRILPEHSAQSPVFAMQPVPPLEEVRAEIEEDFDDPRFTTFVAVHDGRVVGSAIGCSLELSSTNTSLIRPAAAGFLGFAAVLPETRGLGAGRALGETVLAWSRDAGYPWVATDWRTTNPEASRTWAGLGFQPTFLRLQRVIA